MIPELIILISVVLLPHLSGWRLNLLQQLVDIKLSNSNKRLEDADVLMSSIWDGTYNLHRSAVNWTKPLIGQASFQLLRSCLYQVKQQTVLLNTQSWPLFNLLCLLIFHDAVNSLIECGCFIISFSYLIWNIICGSVGMNLYSFLSGLLLQNLCYYSSIINGPGF